MRIPSLYCVPLPSVAHHLFFPFSAPLYSMWLLIGVSTSYSASQKNEPVRIASAPLGAPAGRLRKYNNYRKDKSSNSEHEQANATSPVDKSFATNINAESPRGDSAPRKYVDCSCALN